VPEDRINFKELQPPQKKEEKKAAMLSKAVSESVNKKGYVNKKRKLSDQEDEAPRVCVNN
jgi:hypothetical protein